MARVTLLDELEWIEAEGVKQTNSYADLNHAWDLKKMQLYELARVRVALEKIVACMHREAVEGGWD